LAPLHVAKRARYHFALVDTQKSQKRLTKYLFPRPENPVHKQLLEAQIKYYKLPVGERQLQRKLKEHTKGGQRYKQAYVNKELSDSNLKLQENFGVVDMTTRQLKNTGV
jgi:hypothetical protein